MRGALKRFCLALLVVGLLCGMPGMAVTTYAGTVTTTVANPKKVTLNRSKVQLMVGQKTTLKVTVLPKGAKGGVTWKSSKPSVATVNKQGIVKAIKAGTARITVTTRNGKRATCIVRVSAWKPSTSVPTTTAQATKAIQVAKEYGLSKGMTWDASIKISEAGYLNPPDIRFLSQKNVINDLKYCLDKYCNYSPDDPSLVHFRILRKGHLVYALYQ